MAENQPRQSLNDETPRPSVENQPSMNSSVDSRPRGLSGPPPAVTVHNAPDQVMKEKVDGVLQSDVCSQSFLTQRKLTTHQSGVSILLTRLKQSIAAARVSRHCGTSSYTC